MSPLLSPQSLPPLQLDNNRRLDALCHLIELGQGSFSLALVEFDLPRQLKEVLSKLRERLLKLHIVTVRLTPPPHDAPHTYDVLDQLDRLIKLTSANQTPDALIITGLEALFPQAIHSNDGQITDEIVRALQPLNLGRAKLAQMFPCPLLLCLPSAAMGVALRSAPDLVSWKSGFFQFQTDLDAVQEELKQAAQIKIKWWARREWNQHSPEKLQAEVSAIEALIADARALPLGNQRDNKIIARLYNRLGWMATKLGNGAQARKAFAELLRIAKDTRDKRLAAEAQKGMRAAERVVSTVQIPARQTVAAQEIFKGAAALTEAEGLYGREDELRHLINEVTISPRRFLIVWGETGCGKSSLILAGLVPELKRLGQFLPVVIHQWDMPDANTRIALEQVSELPLEASSSLFTCIQKVAQYEQKTVIIICDQFEQFFSIHLGRSERRPFLKSISDCINDPRAACKFIFVMREDKLGQMVEFEEQDVPEMLAQRNRFYLPLFGETDAEHVLRHLTDKAKLGWQDTFIHTIVSDLTRDGRVRPIELQLVSAALAASGIVNELDYIRAGQAGGLLVDYLQLMLNSLGDPTALKRILLTLIADPPSRLVLTSKEIARRVGYSPTITNDYLNRLVKAHLVQPVGEQSLTEHTDDEEVSRYELTHDKLVELALILSRTLQDRRRQAARTLNRALEDAFLNPHYTIGLRKWLLVKRHCDKRELSDLQAKTLLRKSLIWGILKWFVITPALIILALVLIQNSFGYVRVEQGYIDRVVVRRGIPWLSFLPVIGDDIVLDTGFKADDFKPEQRNKLENLIIWEWGNFQSKALTEPIFRDNLKSVVEQGKLLCQSGEPELGLPRLIGALNTSNGDYYGFVRSEAATALGQVAQADPHLAGQVFPPLLEAITTWAGDLSIRNAVAVSLGRITQADPKLGSQMLPSLLEMFKHKSDDGDTDVRKAAVAALGRIAQADPKLASEILPPLLDELKAKDILVDDEIAVALGQIAQADPKLASQVLPPLLDLLKVRMDDSFIPGGSEAATALGQVAQSDHKLASQVLLPLLEALRLSSNDINNNPQSVAASMRADRNENPYDTSAVMRIREINKRRAAAATSLGHVAQSDPNLANQMIVPLLNALKLNSFDPRSDVDAQRAIQATLKQVVQVDPKDALLPLLEALKNSDDDPFGFQRSAVVAILGQVAQADPKAVDQVSSALQQTLSPLLGKLENNNDMFGLVRRGAITAIGQVAEADPKLASQVLPSLLDIKISDRDLDSSGQRALIITALGEVLRADPKLTNQVLPLLLEALKSNVGDGQEPERRAAARALGKVAQVAPEVREIVFQLLSDYDENVREEIENSLPNIFLSLAVEEKKNDRDPVQFLFDHLEGRRSFLPNQTANTHAGYRKAVLTALARLSGLDKEPSTIQNEVTEKLEYMRAHDKRLHLRIAAWNALAEAVMMREQDETSP